LIRNNIDIGTLSEHEAKFLLSQMLDFTQKLEAENNQLRQEINSLKEELDQFIERKDPTPEINPKAVHIVIGESEAGTIRVGMGDKHRVIGIPDFFAMGPLYRLHEEEGRIFRREWLKNHISDFIEFEYETRFTKTVEEIKAIQEQLPIILWIGDNASEQTGLRFVLFLLTNKPNDVYLIHSTSSYENLINTDEVQYKLMHTGEIIPDKVTIIYEQQLGSPLTEEERSKLASEWRRLSDSKEVLRIWDDDEIKNVAEDNFDSYIVDRARDLHERFGMEEFIKAYRLVGEVYGNLDDLIGDRFIEYRLRSLIYKGILEIKGVPKGIRYYSIRLKQT
jgi:hypothetical protein